MSLITIRSLVTRRRNTSGLESLRPIPPSPPREPVEQPDISIDPKPDYEAPVEKQNALGYDVRNVLRIEGGSYRINETGDEVEYPELVIDSPTIDRTATQYVTTTPTADGPPVVEQMGSGPWELQVRTQVINTDKRGWPRQKLETYLETLRALNRLRVSGREVAALGIREVVVTNLRLPTPRYRNVQEIEMTLLEITPLELEDTL